MPLKTLLGLILANLIWSANPAMAKMVLVDFSPVQVAWLRHVGALLSFLVYRSCVPQLRKEPFFFAKNRNEWINVILLGGMTFCFAPLLQFTGLENSRATDNALIIAMEPMITVFLAWLFLREKVTASYAGWFLAAMTGFGLLAGISFHGFDHGFKLSRAHVYADLLMLISLIGEGYYSIGGRKLLERHSPTSVHGLASFSGVVLLVIAMAIILGQGPVAMIQAVIHQMKWKSAMGVLWLGPLGTTTAYLYWMYALKKAPVASIALTLFIQPVFGSFLGYLFLGERLSASQAFGGILITIAVFAQTLESLRRSKLGQNRA